jgi:hypothetical protein
LTLVSTTLMFFETSPNAAMRSARPFSTSLAVSSTFWTSAVPPAMATAIAAEPIAPRIIAVVLSIAMEFAPSEPLRRRSSYR